MWAFCNGQLMPIAQNEALYSLLGTTYGGDGVQTYGLPNMISRLPVHFGQGQGLSAYALGQTGGQTDVTLTTQMMPSHSHSLNAAKTDATSNTITPSSLTAQPTAGNPPEFYAVADGTTQSHTLAAQSVMNSGGGFPHDNMMPSLCITFIIAQQGLYPSRN
jgi:microcystin-dependent protein